MSIENTLRALKDNAHHLQQIDVSRRNTLLNALATHLRDATSQILKANERDRRAMSTTDPKYDRLLLDAARIEDIAAGVEAIAKLPSPIGQCLWQKTLANGLNLRKMSVPIGVIGVIYESRPNVTVDVFALCFKAGNVCVLKGGKEAGHTNSALVDIIVKSLETTGLTTPCIALLPPLRESTSALLQAVGLVDLCIPRGSQALIDFVRDNAKVPVIETGAGVVHTYWDISGDNQQASDIIFNAKTRRVSVCNALDTLIVHQGKCQDLPDALAPLANEKVSLFADERCYKALDGLYPASLLSPASEADFGQEYLDYKMAIKTVDNVEQALSHIRAHSSGHSEAIIAKDPHVIETFLNQVDAAVVYANASTAFTDGGEFGLGAEIGISTQKLHVRGPMGLEALTSYKWIVTGAGHTR